jgi:hypothetical protein
VSAIDAGRTMVAIASSLSFTAGASSASFRSRFTCFTMCAGVARGARSANQPVATKSGNDSVTVGISGKFGSRYREVIASGLIDPFCIAPTRVPRPSTITEIPTANQILKPGRGAWIRNVGQVDTGLATKSFRRQMRRRTARIRREVQAVRFDLGQGREFADRTHFQIGRDADDHRLFGHNSAGCLRSRTKRDSRNGCYGIFGITPP